MLLGHFGLQLAVEAVGGDEEPVVLRLQLLHPADGGGALRLPISPARLQRCDLQPRPQQGLVAEVPRGLKIIPVGAGDGDTFSGECVYFSVDSSKQLCGERQIPNGPRREIHGRIQSCQALGRHARIAVS